MGYEKKLTTSHNRTITVTRSGEDVFLRLSRPSDGTTISSILSLEQVEALGDMLEEARFWEPPRLPSTGTAVAARDVSSGALVVGRYMGPPNPESDSGSVKVRGYREGEYGTYYVVPESVGAL